MMDSSPNETRPPLPPFTLATAKQKVRAAEDGWNSRDPERVALAYTPRSVWRNRAEFRHRVVTPFITRARCCSRVRDERRKAERTMD